MLPSMNDGVDNNSNGHTAESYKILNPLVFSFTTVCFYGMEGAQPGYELWLKAPVSPSPFLRM